MIRELKVPKTAFLCFEIRIPGQSIIQSEPFDEDEWNRNSLKDKLNKLVSFINLYCQRQQRVYEITLVKYKSPDQADVRSHYMTFSLCYGWYY